MFSVEKSLRIYFTKFVKFDILILFTIRGIRMNFIFGLIAFLFMLSVIVIIHELGHFLVARSFGVHCHEFSIGMGPVLYQHAGKQTIFSIRAIPFGGYVMMAGEEDGSQDDDETDWLKDVPQEERLNNKKPWQQVCVMVAGVVMNVILAWIIFVGLAMARGYEVMPPKPIVAQVVENSSMDKIGMKKEDTIIKVSADGETLKPEDNNEIVEFIQYHHDQVQFTVKRNGQIIQLKPVNLVYDKEIQGYLPGYKVMAYAQKTAWYDGFRLGTQDMIENTTSIFRALGNLVTGTGLENLSGPVGIYQVTAKSAQMGLESYMSLFAMISLNIGIFNLIPIPALDGGRILIVLLEKLLRRKISTKLIENIIMISFVLLIGLFLFATYNDILRLF